MCFKRLQRVFTAGANQHGHLRHKIIVIAEERPPRSTQQTHFTDINYVTVHHAVTI